MAVTYTDNFDFPLAPDTTENWGAIINGVLEDLDALIYSCERCLAEDVAIDLNGAPAAETTLYTVPAGYQFYPTKIILRDFSAACTTAVITLGITGGTCDEFLGDQTLTNITAGFADEILILQPIPNATPVASVILDAAEVLGLEITTAEGGALTCVADVFGKLITI